ncbi:hypothetical protein NC653_015107 [Populus alba x Populus x berolinensis]|uniref:Uncharacterized protein n=1 Tax=Populus alba x Populus x berolinensis TaxID=444605 RepID=A0AAD6W5V0_9ROSI|nr:hypothetical protein NC653_015107 [Populus alba x Populus x berolinensis]
MASLFVLIKHVGEIAVIPHEVLIWLAWRYYGPSRKVWFTFGEWKLEHILLQLRLKARWLASMEGVARIWMPSVIHNATLAWKSVDPRKPFYV